MFIIPMAGASSRFYKAGYNCPKYMLPLGDSIVFDEALKSFQAYFNTEFFLFVVRNVDQSHEFVTKRCHCLKIQNFEIVSLEYETRGQAETVFKGLSQSDYNIDHQELYVFNIDSIRKDFRKPTSRFLKDTAGYLEVFEGEGNHWSFIEPKELDLVARTTEKNRISGLCSNGLYYFNSVGLFKNCFKEMERGNEYNELYVAPMYNILIDAKRLVKFVKVDPKQTLFAGIPEEYEDLLGLFKAEMK